MIPRAHIAPYPASKLYKRPTNRQDAGMGVPLRFRAFFCYPFFNSSAGVPDKPSASSSAQGTTLSISSRNCSRAVFVPYPANPLCAARLCYLTPLSLRQPRSTALAVIREVLQPKCRLGLTIQRQCARRRSPDAQKAAGWVRFAVPFL